MSYKRMSYVPSKISVLSKAPCAISIKGLSAIIDKPQALAWGICSGEIKLGP